MFFGLQYVPTDVPLALRADYSATHGSKASSGSSSVQEKPCTTFSPNLYVVNQQKCIVTNVAATLLPVILTSVANGPSAGIQRAQASPPLCIVHISLTPPSPCATLKQPLASIAPSVSLRQNAPKQPLVCSLTTEKPRTSRFSVYSRFLGLAQLHEGQQLLQTTMPLLHLDLQQQRPREAHKGENLPQAHLPYSCPHATASETLMEVVTQPLSRVMLCFPATPSVSEHCWHE